MALSPVYTSDGSPLFTSDGSQIFVTIPPGGPIRLTQLPVAVAMGFDAIDPFVVGEGQLWRTPAPSCEDD